MRLIEHLEPYIHSVRNYVKFAPKIVTMPCGEHCDEKYINDHCVSKGKYCAMHADHYTKKGAPTKDIVMEDLFHHCLWKVSTQHNNIENYFRYVVLMNRFCEGYAGGSCKEQFMGLMEDDSGGVEYIHDANVCVNGTFTSWDSNSVNYQTDENPTLAEMQEQWNKYGSHLFPSVVINNITFRGQVNADNVFEAACSAFSTLPHGCNQWVNGVGKIEGILYN